MPKEQMMICPTNRNARLLCDDCYEAQEHEHCRTITRLPACPACIPVEKKEEIT